jgi:outer membrane lipoprotein SlyB
MRYLPVSGFNSEKIMTSKLLAVAAAAALLSACAATDPMTGSTTGSLIAVEYGTVQQVQAVKMKASYGKDALIGGGLGLAAASTASSTTQAGAALAGALIGAFIGKETAGTADQYTVQLVNGNTVSIVTEHHDINAGDCVAVEQGEHANIRRVSPQMCTSQTPHTTYPDTHAAVQQQSADCLTAKQELLKATTEQETSVGYQKMKAFCGS